MKIIKIFITGFLFLGLITPVGAANAGEKQLAVLPPGAIGLPKMPINFIVRTSKGCGGKSDPGVKIKFKKINKTTKVVTEIGEYITNSNGTATVIVNSELLDPNIYSYSLYAYKNQFYKSSTYSFTGPELSGGKVVSMTVRSGFQSKETRVGFARSEKKLSESNLTKYTSEAEAMTLEQLIAAVESIYSSYDSDYHDVIRSEIRKKQRANLVSIYADIKTEMFNVHRYTGSKKYQMWCTAFQTWMIRRLGGPNIKEKNATAFGGLFTPTGSQRKGIDEQNYFMKGFYDGVPNTNASFVLAADYWLERVTNASYSGHSALVIAPDQWGNVMTIDGNMSSLVGQFTHEFFGYKVVGKKQEYTKLGRITCLP